MKKLLLLLGIVYFGLNSYAQNNLCANSFPFCTDTVYNFPAGVNAGTAEPGPNYGCLYTQPNPAWYYMEVLNPGNIIIYMNSTPAVDIDFALWGPFSDPSSPCTAALTANCTSCPNNTSNPSFYPSGNLTDCSYSTSWNETAHILNAQTGDVYILLITNYSNQPCNINFLQSNAGQPGAGSTNCGILAPPVSNNGPLCEGQTLNLTAQSGPTGCSYYWTGPNSFVSTQQNPVITNVTQVHAGNYYLQIIIGTDTSNVVSTSVVVHPIPTSDFTVSLDSLCIGDLSTLTYTGTASSTATYFWDVDGGLPNAISGQGPHNISWGSSGNVYVSLYVTENGCTSPTTTVPLYIKPIPLSTFTAFSPVCEQENSQIVYTGTSGSNATYNWDFAGGIISNGSGQGPYEVYWTSSGPYSVSLTVIEDGCTSLPSYQTVLVHPLPVVSITTDFNDGCQPLTVNFEDNINQPPAQYSWDFGNGTTANTQFPTITYNNAGTYNVVLTVTDTNGCVSTNNTSIIVYPLPIAQFSVTPDVATIGQVVTLNSSASVGNINYWSWDFSNGTISNEPNPVTSYTQTGYHTIYLLVETVDGCQDSTSMQVLIIDIVIPNVITPNGDGINDVFKIEGIDLLPNCELVIFNRWGKRVFETKNYQNDWDANGLSDGTYYFIFTLPDGIMKPINGTLNILR